MAFRHWLTALAALGSAAGEAAPLRPDQQTFRALYAELVEADTSTSTGDCTLAADRMLKRLRSAGFGPDVAETFTPADHPRDGGLIARLDGTDRNAPALLLVDHIDVVDADPADWGRDPFKLVEANGYFTARGVIDDKALAAIWIDSLIRMKAAGYKPRHTIKVALTCGEESGDRVNGVDWLLRHKRGAMQAGMALNEGGHGMTDATGKPIALLLAVGEKQSQTYTIETRNPGGHSSRPRADNALYEMAEALLKVRALAFPIRRNDANRAFFDRMGTIVGGEMGAAMRAVGAGSDDPAILARVTRDPVYNATLRTTCVATTLNAGKAVNALPQQVRGQIQCRLFPGDTAEAVLQALRTAIADPAVTLTPENPGGLIAIAPPLTPAVLAPAEAVAREVFPGLPVIPTLLTAGTDGKYLSAAGIPTYGVPGIPLDPDGNGAHGVNERIRVESVYRGRDYLYALIKRYADAHP